MSKTVLFWVLMGGLGFAFALAIQMRVMVALVLRRALKAWNDVFEDRVKANKAVVCAADEAPLANEAEAWLVSAVDHLKTTYPMPLRHLRRARRYSFVMPVLMVITLAIGRFGLGVI